MSANEEPPSTLDANNTKCEEVIVEISKQSIRKKVWDYLEKNDLGLSHVRRVDFKRIPNFKGSDDAANKLADLEIFKSAKVIKANPDKPQEAVRFLALQAKKSLLVPIPQLRTGLLQLVEVPEDAGNKEIKRAASRRGAEQFGKPLPINEKIKVDLVVLGAVAVSKEGHRIGKGEGFADLEYAMMANMGAFTPDTVIVTTVHDGQVFETLPETLFEPYDVPVDIIVTPTQVYNVSRRLPKPEGIIWKLLSSRRLNSIPLLQTIREEYIAAGDMCILKEVDSDVEERPPRVANGRGDARPRRFRRRRMLSSKSGENGEIKTEGEEGDGEVKRPTRTFRRRRNSARKPKEDYVEGVDDSADQEKLKPQRRVRQIRPRQRPPIEFSLRVDNIGTDVRVRDLKAALAERGVKPTDITWRGHRGFAFLHFAKDRPPREATSDTEGAKMPTGVDDVIASLQDIKLGGAEGAEDPVLKIEPAKPVTRIEVTDITAV